jgi:hypothetical protein
VVLAGYVKLRDRHWFEQPENGDADADLYAPASMLFAGALARTDRTTGGGIAQGPVGMIFGKLRGVERARIEPRISQMEHLSMERQIVTIIRNEDNDLCFVGSRSQAEDPNGVLKFFSSYRVLRYLERRMAVYLRRVAEQRLTRDLVKDQVRNPIEDFLEGEKKKGTIYSYDLNIDMDESKFAQGVLDISLEVLPVGPAETFLLKIDTPEFRPKTDGFSSLRLRSVGRSAPLAGVDAVDGAPAAPSLAAAEGRKVGQPEPPAASSPVRRLLRWLGLG